VRARNVDVLVYGNVSCRVNCICIMRLIDKTGSASEFGLWFGITLKL